MGLIRPAALCISVPGLLFRAAWRTKLLTRNPGQGDSRGFPQRCVLLAAASEVTLENFERVANLGCRHGFNPPG